MNKYIYIYIPVSAFVDFFKLQVFVWGMVKCLTYLIQSNNYIYMRILEKQQCQSVLILVLTLVINFVKRSSRYSYGRQSYKPIECIKSPTCCVDSATGLFQGFLVLQTVGPTQYQDYRYDGEEQCAISSTFCWTTDTLVKTSVSLVLLLKEYQ